MISLVKLFYPVACLACLFVLPPKDGFSQHGRSPVKFSQLGTLDGLSQSSVNCILKDKYGFLWFGTQDGLNKFDGDHFTVYRNNPGDPGSIPDNQIKCIFEDSLSNLWIGTLGGGLCYFDRNRNVFIRLADMGMRSDAPVNPAILSIYEDRKDNLWVGTFRDLLLIDRKNKRISHFEARPGDSSGLSNQTIQAIYEDSRNNLWIGTDGGLNLFNRRNGKFTRFFHEERNPKSISSNRVTAITEDRLGRLWIGTNGGGLDLFDSRKGEFYAFRKQTAENSICNDVVRSLCQEGDDELWVGTEDGLDLLDENSGLFVHYKKTAIRAGGLSDKTILSLRKDNNGILWAGTSEGGINKYDPNLFYFNLQRRTADPNSLNADIITSFAEDKQGNIWIGTDGGGLNEWLQADGRFIHYLPDPKAKNALSGHTVLSLLMSRKKDCLWIGTYGDGLDRLDLKTKSFRHYRMGSGPRDLNNASIYALLEDREGNIWMGTNGGGVDVLNPENGTITKHRHTDDADSISNDYIRSLLEDREGRIWIGTYSGGISLYDPGTRKFIVYNKAGNSLSNQVVYSLCEDSKGNIWAGTMGGGLDLFNRQTKQFIAFTEENGLSNNIVNSIIEDDRGYLWLSTNKGISRFNPVSREFKNYGIYNGLQGQEFFAGSGHKTRNGRILFGGVNGFNDFNPDHVLENKTAPVCRFTGFFLFNKPVDPGAKNSPLEENINATKEIALTYNQSDFTIAYAALSYTIPENNQYAYMLEGFDKTWTNAGHDLKATYTNLPPGDYRFKVKAANNDGVWNNKPTVLIIHISPPFWKTWWAYLLYLLMLFTILYIIYQEITNKERLKAQIRMERLTADKMKELNRIKLNFFTHVSHELRTPLSLIMDPLRKIISEPVTAEQTKKYGSLMYNNARRLMKLIDQMLDLRKLEAGHVRLAARPANIVTVTKNIAALFDVHAVERNIHYSLTAASEDLQVWIDQDKFEKIIFNLISNAFKYTPDNGSISIRICSGKPEEAGEKETGQEEKQAAGEFALIHVKDTGVGIPPHLKDKVFEIFYQVEGSSRYENGSTGIGLALTRELIELHKGRVEVKSEPGKGSDFIIYLPLGNQHLDPEEQPEISGKEDTGKPDEIPTGSSQSQDVSEKTGKNNYPLAGAEPGVAAIKEAGEIGSCPDQDPAPLLLLVEDNKDLREYLKEELSRFYSVEDAPDGSVGYEMAVQSIPDLIISDIMMPEVTGLELCRKIKTDERTSHIPVILLTAKQAEEHRIEGYSIGADAYIPKPFNTDVVLARIKNLLDSRRKLRELYGKGGEVKSLASESLPHMNPIDQQFLNKAVRLVEENISDIRFDTDMLADQLKVSRRQLYRKLKALTNQTVHDFVTDIRLRKAADFLATGEFTVSEIAYKVGYSEPANFSRSFTRRFGKSPRKYVAEEGGNG